MSGLASIAIEQTHSSTDQRPHYYARSFGDPLSRLFWREGELWMGLLEPQCDYFEEVMCSGKLDDLFTERLLCAIQRQSLSLEPFQATYRLERTPRIVYWHEWPAEMLRAGAQSLSRLMERLAQRGLMLRNPHPWEFLFFGSEFSYINPGSIVPLDMTTFARAYEKLARYFVRPLVLIGSGFAHIARNLMRDAQNGVQGEDFVIGHRLWADWDEADASDAITPFLSKVQEEIGLLTLISSGNRWGSYFDTDCDFAPGTSWSRKRETLDRLLRETDIRTVLDIGANQGYYSQQTADQGREVIATDFDATLVDEIFLKRQQSPGTVFPAVLDFSHPSSGQGVNSGWLPPASQRMNSDLVLFFAISHHMIFGRYRMDFEEIAKGIKSFAKLWAIVEYVGLEDVRPQEWRPDSVKWYSLDYCITALRRYFPRVDPLPAANDGRTLIVCGPRCLYEQ